MVAKTENRTKHNYASFAGSAVEAERHGEFAQAAALWEKARQFSYSAGVSFWVERRVEFCGNAAFRGWGVPGGCQRI